MTWLYRADLIKWISQYIYIYSLFLSLRNIKWSGVLCPEISSRAHHGEIFISSEPISILLDLRYNFNQFLFFVSSLTFLFYHNLKYILLPNESSRMMFIRRPIKKSFSVALPRGAISWSSEKHSFKRSITDWKRSID